MLGGHYFKRLRRRRPHQAVTLEPTPENLLLLLAQHVVEPFGCVSDAAAVAVSPNPPVPKDGEDPPDNPGHPACVEYANTDYCRESWQLHLAELSRHPETHRHRCDYERHCAVLPVVHGDRCLAVVKLACPPTVAEEEFEHVVEYLDLLVKDFARSEAEFLSRLPWSALPVAEPSEDPLPTTAEPVGPQVDHPQISRAIQYIDEHLPDPQLTVSRVAQALGVHANYLSRLFVDQLGQRMSRFIAGRRIELAKTLLTTTDRQIKHIARETGHANPNWFVHVFTAYTGLTPGAYRKRSRGLPRSAG
ncbi:MAG: AraC family transcriptional regulator [Planctomycetota bacterium]